MTIWDKPAKIIPKCDNTREIVFAQRDDGFFAFHERLGDGDKTEYERPPDFIPWPNMVDHPGIYGSLSEAEADARKLVPWLAKRSEEN
jgi:hypothetical protein